MTLNDLRDQRGIINSSMARVPHNAAYKPLLAMVNYRRDKEGSIMDFYSHELKEGDIMTNIWLSTQNNTSILIQVTEILERADATGDWDDDFNKNLWCRARVLLIPIAQK